jgi:hypothetical protein
VRLRESVREDLMNLNRKAVQKKCHRPVAEFNELDAFELASSLFRTSFREPFDGFDLTTVLGSYWT